MTIAHLVAYYPPHLGGMENVAYTLAEATSRRGRDVEVITSDQGAGDAPRLDRHGNLVVRRLRSLEIAHTPITWGVVYRLARLPRRSLVHVHVSQVGFPEAAIAVAKFRSHTTVAHFHLDVPPSGPLGRLFTLYKRTLFGAVMRRMDRVIALSNDQRELLVTRYGVERHRVDVVHNAPDPSFVRTRPYGPSPDRLRVLYVGRLSAQKHVDRVIDSFARLAVPAELSIVGDGELRDELERRAAASGAADRITFHGAKSGAALREAYERADVLVMTSDVEGWSLVLLEAMAMGVPIVATDVLGNHEMIDGTGVLIEEPYVDNLATALADLAGDRNRLRSLSAASVRRARDFSAETVLDQLFTIYEKAAG
ncbi:MAG: glycosyltransferase family 4 protein [Acidimicrobiia bacterium]